MAFRLIGIPESQIQYRYLNLKLQQNCGIIAVQETSNKVVGVLLTEDFLDFASCNLNNKTTYSEGFEYYRQNYLVPCIKDYLARYPNAKRGEIVYNYAGCVDFQFSNQHILKNIMLTLKQYNKNRGYKFSIAITQEPKVLKTANPIIDTITQYKVPNPIFKGKMIPMKSYVIQKNLNQDSKAKL